MMPTDKTVLVVDDEPLIREIVCEWLELEGYRVFSAEDGISALRVITSSDVDLVVTDLRMPGMDGQTLLKRLVDFTPPPKAIVITAFADFPADAGPDLGVNSILVKPFSEDQLLSAVRSSLSQLNCHRHA